MRFPEVFDRVIGHEGGYVNDPNDPGGETQWGISKRSYPHLNIRMLTRAEAMGIYDRDFWQPLHGDRLHDGVAFQLFDFAVNSGMDTAVRYLQRAIGVADDGVWGPDSQAAHDALSEAEIILRLTAERLDFMTRLKNWPHHGKGWTRRMAANLRYGARDL
jgi:lysozyme family protein